MTNLRTIVAQSDDTSSTTSAPENYQAVVRALHYEAQNVVSVELCPADRGEFPPFTPGSHIDLHLPNGLVRNYSLCNDSSERHRYVVGVLNDRASRGGSRYVHESLRVGSTITISGPRNNFALQEEAAHTVLVAGGIGITPLLSMARKLKELNRSFEMVYLARERKSAAFLAELQAMGMPLRLHFDAESNGPPDLRAMLAKRLPDSGTHYYACGPKPMLDAFEIFCAELGHTNTHVERFMALDVKPAADARTHYVVELKRSGYVIVVTPELSLLDTLLSVGVDVRHGCRKGVCGACKTTVLGGVPDHRDSVLTSEERTSNMMMQVCVSGCKSETLVLDL